MGRAAGPSSLAAAPVLRVAGQELQGVDEKTAREAFRLAGHKLPVAFKFIQRGEVQ